MGSRHAGGDVETEGVRVGTATGGVLDRDAFDTFVTTVLAPSLQPGDVVVLDNLSVPKSVAAHQAVAAVGAQLVFVPAYSPDINPIEQAFATLKQGLRAAGTHSLDTVIAVTRALYTRITATRAHGFYTQLRVLLVRTALPSVWQVNAQGLAPSRIHPGMIPCAGLASEAVS